MGMCGVCASVCGCVRVGGGGECMGMHGCAQVCVDMYGCGMYFQNFFWRIESLHQRTLIRFLYEFFKQILTKVINQNQDVTC